MAELSCGNALDVHPGPPVELGYVNLAFGLGVAHLLIGFSNKYGDLS